MWMIIYSMQQLSNQEKLTLEIIHHAGLVHLQSISRGLPPPNPHFLGAPAPKPPVDYVSNAFSLILSQRCVRKQTWRPAKSRLLISRLLMTGETRSKQCHDANGGLISSISNCFSVYFMTSETIITRTTWYFNRNDLFHTDYNASKFPNIVFRFSDA